MGQDATAEARKVVPVALLTPFRFRQGVQNFCRGGAAAVLLDNLAKEDDTMPVDQECRGVSRLVGCVPTQAIEICEFVAGVDQQVKALRKHLAGSELRRLCGQVIRGTRIDQYHTRSGVDETLRLADEILNLAIAVRALIARIPS